MDDQKHLFRRDLVQIIGIAYDALIFNALCGICSTTASNTNVNHKISSYENDIYVEKRIAYRKLIFITTESCIEYFGFCVSAYRGRINYLRNSSPTSFISHCFLPEIWLPSAVRIPLAQLIFNENLSYWRWKFINFRFVAPHKHPHSFVFQCSFAVYLSWKLCAICRWWAYSNRCNGFVALFLFLFSHFVFSVFFGFVFSCLCLGEGEWHPAAIRRCFYLVICAGACSFY